MAMEGVSVLLNGFEVGSDFEPDGDEYHIMISGAADGAYTLAVVASDQAGNTARAEIDLTIARAATGEDCATDTDCVGNVCAATTSGDRFCSQACDPGNDTCPDGFACNETASLCAPAEDAGCCSTGASPSGATWVLIAGVGLLLVRRRRRR